MEKVYKNYATILKGSYTLDEKEQEELNKGMMQELNSIIESNDNKPLTFLTEGVDKIYPTITLDKLKSTIEEVFGKEDFNLLGITKINDNCYQIEGNNGTIFLTGKLGVVKYIKAFERELIKYRNTLEQDGK